MLQSFIHQSTRYFYYVCLAMLLYNALVVLITHDQQRLRFVYYIVNQALDIY